MKRLTNHGYEATTATRPAVERAWGYRPETEWGYSRHPFLMVFNGRYYLMWSNGRKNEDAPGQRVLLSTSADFRNWTAPVPLVDGVHFDRHFILGDESTPYRQRMEGMHKGGDYGYPGTLAHDGHLHVVISRMKEAVEALRVPIAAQ